MNDTNAVIRNVPPCPPVSSGNDDDAFVVSDLANWADEVNSEHSAALDSAETAIAHAKRAGGLLIKAKQALNHGDWLPWLASNIRLSERHVQNYMKLARENPQRVADMSQRRALAELAAPSKARTVHVASTMQASDKPDASTVLNGGGDVTPPACPADGRTDPHGSDLVDEVNLDERWVPDDDEDARIELVEKEITASIDRVMKADDMMTAAHDEIKRQAAEIAVLKLSRDGYMNERLMAIRLCKTRLRENQRLKADNKEFRKRMARLMEMQS